MTLFSYVNPLDNCKNILRELYAFALIDKLMKARSRCQTLVAVLSSWLRHLNEPTALEALSLSFVNHRKYTLHIYYIFAIAQ